VRVGILSRRSVDRRGELTALVLYVWLEKKGHLPTILVDEAFDEQYIFERCDTGPDMDSTEFDVVINSCDFMPDALSLLKNEFYEQLPKSLWESFRNICAKNHGNVKSSDAMPRTARKIESAIAKRTGYEPKWEFQKRTDTSKSGSLFSVKPREILAVNAKASQGQKYRAAANLVDYKIQNLMFPDCDWKDEHWWMMQRGERLAFDVEDNSWHLPTGAIECFTYFNSLSVRKWDTYTNAFGYKLHLKIKGEFKIFFFGHWLESKNHKTDALFFDLLDEVRLLAITEVEKRAFLHRLINEAEIHKETFAEHSFNTKGEIQDIELPIEYKNATVISFSLVTKEAATIYGGYWSAVCDKTKLNDVNIALCTTTFKKEDFIIPNINLIKKEIFDIVAETGMDECGKHFFVNVVDNGQTLRTHDIETSFVKLYPNPNTGGAGGFSRGMMETAKLKESNQFDATHILFMDDDIKVLPESIKRTYALLRLLKPEYKDRFISGAMLDINHMNEQYEDLGFCSDAAGAYMSQKPKLYLHLTDQILKNEEDFSLHNNYAAWWYCCVPIKFVDKDKLSYPIFYRGDDVDFSLRNNAEFITMNGICVWHLAFNAKVTPSLEFYLVNRNSMITQALDGIANSVSYIDRIKFLFGEEIRKFNYVACDHLLDAVDDFLKGPDYIASLPHEYVIKVQSAKNEKMRPLTDFGQNIDTRDAWQYSHLGANDLELFIETDNGHTLPDYCLKDEATPIIAHLFFESPGRQFLQRQLLAVDVNNRLAILHKMDKARYRELKARYDALLAKWDSEYRDVAKRYRRVAPLWRSEEFWNNYLEG
jgi:GT2 family glycosyltransferase